VRREEGRGRRGRGNVVEKKERGRYMGKSGCILLYFDMYFI